MQRNHLVSLRPFVLALSLAATSCGGPAPSSVDDEADTATDEDAADEVADLSPGGDTDDVVTPPTDDGTTTGGSPTGGGTTTPGDNTDVTDGSDSSAGQEPTPPAEPPAPVPTVDPTWGAGELAIPSEQVFAVPSATSQVQDLLAAESGLPFDLKIWVPSVPGTYGVVVFLPGFGITTQRLTNLLGHVAGHGAVVVAVGLQSSPFNPVTTAEEAASMVPVLDFVTDGLAAFVTGTNAAASIDGLPPVLAAHSRGGKLSWRVLLDDPTAARGIAFIDPVDAPPPAISGVTDENAVTGPLGFTGPAMVLGTGLGSTGTFGGFGPACAPEGDNHVRFAEALAAATHVVDPAAGHNDLLDDPGNACVKGTAMTQFRTAAAGLIVAVLREVHGVAGATAAAASSSAAPVTLTTP
ncbi:MAG: chlorophyllase/cutinase-like alpha/beta fold protein [Myxococcota bacterium]